MSVNGEDLGDMDSQSNLSEEREEGEVNLVNTEKKSMVISDSDDEEDSEEMDELDRMFIADDDDDEQEIRKRRKKKRKLEDAVEEDIADEISEDDLELIQENYGIEGKSKKRLIRKGEMDKDALLHIFDDDDLNDEDGEERFGDSHLDDGLEDFIIGDEDEEEQTEEMLQEKRRMRKKRLEMAQNLGSRLGIDDDTWRDIQELFGDGGEYNFALYGENELDQLDEYDNEEEGEEGFQAKQRKQKEIKLKDVYEPSEITEKMLTEQDEQIRIKDMPERLQLLDIDNSLKEKHEFDDSKLPSEKDITNEALFISRQLKKDSPDLPEKELIVAVNHILRFLKIDQFEVPFIFAHRKDRFEPILRHYDLWKIYDMDAKYTLADSKKKALTKLVEDISKKIDLDPTVQSMVHRVYSVDEASDVSHYINTAYPLQVEEILQEKRTAVKIRYKKPFWKITFDDAKRNNLDEYAQLFGIKTNEYVTSITTQRREHFPEDYYQHPLDSAVPFLCTRFPKPQQVLEAAKILLGHQIAAHPTLRQFIRRVYFTDAVVSVKVTDLGKKEIEPSHPYYFFKYLKNKPIYKFNDGQFLQIVDAESKGLLKISIRVEEEQLLIDDCIKHICNDDVNENAKKWNNERTVIALYAAKEVLFPYAEKWLKEKLIALAQEWISTSCRIAMEKKINVAPFKNLELGEDLIEDEFPVVMSVTWGEGDRNSVGYATILNENGELVDFLKMPTLVDRDNAAAVDRLIELVAQHSPEVIALGGFKPNTKSVLFKIIEERVEAYGRSAGKWDTQIPILFVEDDIARLFMNSKRGLIDFPEKDYPMLIRYCVALGRKVQNPTIAYASLFNADEDFRAIRLDPLQNLLPEDVLKSAVERSFLNVVNQCGVDINLAANYPHLSGTLQFVSGLGPRKAQAFISKIIRSGGKLENRHDLINKNICGSNVFINCASFIRIRAFHFISSYRETQLDVLDDTRIHPEDYELARKMAADALDIDEPDEENPSANVQELMQEDPDRLNLLLLEDYAVELEKQTGVPKRICLNDIKEELMAPYKDKRQRSESATIDEIFVMLTGESPETFKEGTLTSASITKAQKAFMACKLPSGMDGAIYFQELDLPHGDEEYAARHYPVHSVLQCVVLKVDKERIFAELTARQAVIERSQQYPTDAFFSKDAESNDMNEVNSLIKKDAKKHRQKRVIPHPFFHDFNFNQAEEYLADKNVGDIVVRPSTKGNNHISITWKVYDGIYQHLDILELMKDTEFTLGKKLKIDELEFNEIDQIIAEYIEPMTRKIKKLVEHPKFQRKSMNEMCNIPLFLLLVAFVEEQAITLKRSAYGFILIADKPGTFYLIFKHPSNSRKHEYVVIKPSGYLFRKKMFGRIEELLDYFKTNEAEKSQISRHPSNIQRNQGQRPPDRRVVNIRGPPANNAPAISHRGIPVHPQRYNMPPGANPNRGFPSNGRY